MANEVELHKKRVCMGVCGCVQLCDWVANNKNEKQWINA